MVLDLEKLQEKYTLDIRGIIHIGAHHGLEYSIYKKIGITNLLFFEPIPECFKVLKKNVEGIIVNKALGNYNGRATMHVASNEGISSSLLKPLYHSVQYPNILFDRTLEVDIIKLDDYIGYNTEYNFINIDVQGYELEVFRGGKETLSTIDYVMTEVNRRELYNGCVQFTELDCFLDEYGFERVETLWSGTTWGDAFYIKK